MLIKKNISENQFKGIIMADYQYTTVPGKLKKLLSKIREVGVPSKASIKWLKSIGFKSSNDGTLLTVLKFINFIDSSSVPTEKWKDYRGANHSQVLASAIREGYEDLYTVYPDAHLRGQSEIEHVVSTSSSAGKQVVGKTVRTFQSLCEQADFSASGVPKPPANSIPPKGINIGSQIQPSLHIDIQIHISPDAKPEQIEQIFNSMAKHLYKGKDVS
jgi:hypothetical protein